MRKGEQSRHCTRCDAKIDITDIEFADHKYENDVCIWCGEKYSLEEATDLAYTLSSDGTYYIVSGIGLGDAARPLQFRRFIMICL